MNRCDEHAADILLYLRDELTGQKLDEFREHLASCPDCSAHLEEELALSSLLRKSLQILRSACGQQLTWRLRPRLTAAISMASCHFSADRTRPKQLLRGSQTRPHSTFDCQPFSRRRTAHRFTV